MFVFDINSRAQDFFHRLGWQDDGGRREHEDVTSWRMRLSASPRPSR